jgi:nitrite reductase/ring-hydroxylating ferredoxin subunit
MPAYVKVAKLSEIEPGTGRLVEAGGKRIALFNVDGTFYAWARPAPIAADRCRKACWSARK